MAGPTGGIPEKAMTRETPLPEAAGLAAKAVLRAQVRENLKKLGATERTAATAAAGERLRGAALWQAARTMLFYAPLPDELDVWPLLEMAMALGKAVWLPRFDAAKQQYEVCRVHDLVRDTRVGRYGVREPVGEGPGLNRLDLILVPGVAFDLDGWRLGRGKGYYDRLLATIAGPTCGVAFNEQIVKQVPVAPHDIRMDWLLTPTHWQQTRAIRAT